MLATIETVILELDSMHTALQALSAEMRDAAANHVDAVAWESYRGVHADVAATASRRDEMPLHTAMMDVVSGLLYDELWVILIWVSRVETLC